MALFQQLETRVVLTCWCCKRVRLFVDFYLLEIVGAAVQSVPPSSVSIHLFWFDDDWRPHDGGQGITHLSLFLAGAGNDDADSAFSLSHTHTHTWK